MHMLDNEPTTQVICNFRQQRWHDYKEIRENDFFKTQRDGTLCVGRRCSARIGTSLGKKAVKAHPMLIISCKMNKENVFLAK